jgi:hypothetical protein
MNMVEFQVVFECLICNPAEGHKVDCVTKSITKAGIHAEVTIDGIVPMKIFIARDHNYSNQTFGQIKENDTIKVQIIGKRFELNDPYIVAIASLVENKKTRTIKPTTVKPKITVLEEPVDADIEDEPEYVEEEDDVEIQAPISIPTLQDAQSQNLGAIGKPQSQNPGAIGKPQSQNPGAIGNPQSQNPGAIGNPQSQNPGAIGNPQSQNPGAIGNPQSLEEGEIEE